MKTALTERLRGALAGLPQVEEKRMTGGTAFMVNGRMCIGEVRGQLVCRIDPKGLVRLNVGSARELRHWIDRCLEYNWSAS